jgi:acylphosphatase
MENPPRLVKVRIHGDVQGVGYRAWTQSRAQQRHLRGYVRNCENGDVEAVFVGAAESVSALIEACRRGPRMARVAAVDVDEITGAAATEFLRLQEFTIRPTR